MMDMFKQIDAIELAEKGKNSFHKNKETLKFSLTNGIPRNSHGVAKVGWINI